MDWLFALGFIAAVALMWGGLWSDARRHWRAAYREERKTVTSQNWRRNAD